MPAADQVRNKHGGLNNICRKRDLGICACFCQNMTGMTKAAYGALHDSISLTWKSTDVDLCQGYIGKLDLPKILFFSLFALSDLLPRE